jgi:hypothetical protein
MTSRSDHTFGHTKSDQRLIGDVLRGRTERRGATEVAISGYDLGRPYVRPEPGHEKQYAMKLLYLSENGQRNPDAVLGPEWEMLVGYLSSSAFMDWLASGTDLSPRHLVTNFGMYTHDDGDLISVLMDKPDEALTAILCANEHRRLDGAGHHEVLRNEPVAVQ